MSTELTPQQLSVEQFRIKRLIKKLDDSRGNGTSMISIVIPPKKSIVDITKMLSDEISKATNIKDRVNRQSVQACQTSARERLKLYNKTPNNGLVLFCGTGLEADGKTEKKLLIDFEPFKPINTSLYFCDNKFHCEELKQLLACEPPTGFIIIDGNGALFASIQGNNREILHKFGVELPKKHGRGGQSSVRFARLRMEKRHNYLRKVCEVATQVFITNNMPNVQGLVLGGSADFKNDLMGSQMFDPRLQTKVIKIVDCSYGGENGLSQAIDLAQDCLKDVKFIQEKLIVSRFFEEISKDTGLYTYGLQDTMRSLESGALKTILCFENNTYWRICLMNKETNIPSVIYLRQEELNDPKHYRDKSGAELESVEQAPLAEWVAEHYHEFGVELEFITDKSPEGFQFVKGFAGIGGFLRYKFDVEVLDANFGVQEEDEDLEDDFI